MICINKHKKLNGTDSATATILIEITNVLDRQTDRHFDAIIKPTLFSSDALLAKSQGKEKWQLDNNIKRTKFNGGE